MGFASHAARRLRIEQGYRFDEVAGAGYQVLEKLASFVGRAFSYDKKPAFSSGVSTPEDLSANYLLAWMSVT